MKLFTFIIGLLLLTSCASNTVDIKKFAWLQGKWEGSYNEMQTFEEWQPMNGKSMSGNGGVLSGTDTMFVEKIKMEQRDGVLYYSATVPGNTGPVEFKFTGFINDSTIFENPEHDFPQRIVYFKNASGFYACVDGIRLGKYAKEEFNFKKVK